MDIEKVTYSDVRTIVNSILSTEPSVVTGTRGTAYNYEDFALTADTLTISTKKQIPIFIDEADRHQQSYFTQIEIADFQGRKINEKLESEVLGRHASWTDFGVGDLNNTSSDDTAQITVSASNIDDLIRAVKRKIYKNNGIELAIQNGFFFVWRPGDYELLEAFVQANGFSEADVALKNGVPIGLRYMGKSIAHTKSSLIVSEIQKWIMRAKEAIASTLNDLTRGLLPPMRLADAKV